MLRFAKDNGNGIVEMSSKFWWGVKSVVAFCIGLSIAAFAWGSRTATWTAAIGGNRSDIMELKIENKEQDMRLEDVKEIVIRIDERTTKMGKTIEKIERTLEK